MAQMDSQSEFLILEFYTCFLPVIHVLVEEIVSQFSRTCLFSTADNIFESIFIGHEPYYFTFIIYRLIAKFLNLIHLQI